MRDVLYQFQPLQEGLPSGKEEDSREYSPRTQHGKLTSDRSEHGRAGGFQDVEKNIAYLKDIDA